MKKILITGGLGFIGSNLVKYLFQNYYDYKIFVIDALTYAGNRDNIDAKIWHDPRFIFLYGSIRNREILHKIIPQIDVVVHMAAETHVDNSIYNTDDFIDTDVKGTQDLLDSVRKAEIERFIHISTSEVYGTSISEPMDENHPLNPKSPYAGAKTGADRLVYAYFSTFDIPAVILRPFNNYGPNQHIEKVIPCFITHLLQNKNIPMHGDGASSRDWLYVEDTCEAVDKTIHVDIRKIKGEIINIGTGRSVAVKEIAYMILSRLNKAHSYIKEVPNRPGQVFRHISSTRKSEELLGWKYKWNFEKGLEKTIQWYMDNEQWWRKLEVKHPHFTEQWWQKSKILTT